MKHKTGAVECLDCTHLKKKKIYLASTVVLLVVLFVTVAAVYVTRGNLDAFAIYPVKYTSPSEKESGRYSFAVSAQSLKDGRGNTIDIHGGGKAGMSGWIMFGLGFDLTLAGTGSGIITLTTIEGEKYTTRWEIAKSRFFALTNWYMLLKIKLKDTTSGLPQELYLELTEGDKPDLGSIVLSTELPTLVNDELTPQGVISSGTGVVVIH